MSYVQMGHAPLDYEPCQYPGSPMTFRGPQADLEEPFVLCLGGSETYGKFAADPFPQRLADRLGRRVVNMGAVNAGVDLFLHDPAVAEAMRKADAVVLQVPGAANMSNRFFTVHPRRNDRFLKASTMLRTIYREVDFTEFHYTRHMLSGLQERSTERFRIVIEELQIAWRARMAQLLSRIDVPVHLLWLSHRAPEEEPDYEDNLGYDPLFVTGKMFDELSPIAESVTVSLFEGEGGVPARRGLQYGRGEEAAARLMPGSAEHEAVSQALAARLN